MLRRRKIQQASEEVGWNCDITIQKEGWNVELSIYSPAGQDVFYDFIVSTLNEISERVNDIYECYSPDEEALLWYKQGRGEPSSLRELLDDMEWVEDKLCELNEALKFV